MSKVRHASPVTSQTPQPVVVETPAAAPGNGFAVAALVLGIAAMVLGIIPLVGLFLSFLPTLLAIIFGIIGITRSQRVQRGLAPAIIGLALGGLTLLLYFVGYGTFW